MVRRVFVRLREPEIDRLVELARNQRRHPSDQAAELVMEGLHRRKVEPQTSAPERELIPA